MRLEVFHIAMISCLCCFTAAAQKSDSLDRSFILGNGSSVVVEVDRGSILIETGGPNVRVKVLRSARGGDAKFCERLLQSQAMELEVRSSTLYVDASAASGSEDFYRAHSSKLGVDLRITVPRSVTLDLKTGNGSIRVPSITGSINATTSRGSVHIESATDAIRATAAGGAITIGRGIGPIDLETNGGSITIGEASAAVTAKAGGGSIDLNLSSAPSDHVVLSSEGNIDIRMGRQVGMNLDASAKTGKVQVNVPISIESQKGASQISGPINGGGVRLDLTSNTGSVRINPLQ